ncbi:MAG: sugar ABC transporter permease [Clostridiales bacterium]|nr:sugar ABC transporter permease [Clostridiales bacterium]
MYNVMGEKKKDIGALVFIISMLIIPIVMFLFFYVYINFNSILMAFQIPLYDGLGGFEWGLDNFEKVFEQFSNSDEDLWAYLGNTAIFFFTDTFVSLPLSLVICYFIYKKIAGYQAFRTIIYLPVIITTTIFATLYKGMIEAGGPLQALYAQWGVEPPSTFVMAEEFALKTMLIFVIYTGLGGRFVLFGGAMNSIDSSIIDAGKIDGASPFRELVSIIVPCIWPTLSTMLLLCSTGIFTASGPSLLFDKGDYGTKTISYWIYDITSGSGSAGESVELASAIGLVFTLLGLPIVLVVKKLTGITEDN